MFLFYISFNKLSCWSDGDRNGILLSGWYSSKNQGEITYEMLVTEHGLKKGFGEHLQDGGGVRRGDHLPPHKYIKSTSTNGTNPTECLLNTGRRPQTSPNARNSSRTWVGQKKKEKTETKNRDGTCTSGRELWRRKSYHTLGSPSTGRDRGWVGGEASEPRRRAQQQGCGGQSREIPAQRIGDDQHSPAQ